MKTRITLLLFTFLSVMAFSPGLSGQCTEYLAPDGSPGYTTFNASYGGAPITIAGCPQYFEVTAFEVFASEAYVVDDVQMGTTYAFNTCNGPGASNWIPDYTIISPSGAVDAFGTDADSCTITWTATETGTYQILVNEEGACGGGDNTFTDGGFPALTIVTDETCDTSVCTSWLAPNSALGYTTFNAVFGGAPCDDGDGCDTFALAFEAFSAEAYSIDNFQAGGEYSFNLCNGDGAGAWIPEFTIIAPSGAVDASGVGTDSCTIIWTASEDGTYLIVINEQGFCGGGDNTATDGGIPTLTCLGGTMCPDCLIGELSTIDEVQVCGDEEVATINYDGVVAPVGGGIGAIFIAGDDGTGAVPAFSISGISLPFSFDNEVNGILPANMLDSLSGSWNVHAYIYTDTLAPAGSICAEATDTVLVSFLTQVQCDSMPMEACTEWVANGGSPWSNFVDLGGAPCDDGTGCNAVTLDIEAWASEAYTMPNIQEGGMYVFSICEGDGVGSWIPEFTILTPEGVVDAFGLGDGDGCSITWTASTSGTYVIVISEAGECNGGSNTTTDNGFPTITCLGGTMCPDCSTGVISSASDIVVCGSLDSFMISLDDVLIPEGGGIGYRFGPGDDGTGGNGVGFSLTNSAANVSFTSDLNGILPDNNLDALAGTWLVTPFVYTDTLAATNSACEVSENAISVFFSSDILITATDIGGGQAEAIVDGGAGPYSYLWSDADGQTGDTLSATEDGIYIVMVTDSVGCTAMDSVSIISTSVEDLPGVEALRISPNPTSGMLFVDMELATAEDVNVTLFDMNGKRLDSRNFYSQGTRLNFNLNEYAKGMYLVRITVGEASTTKKVILTR